MPTRDQFSPRIVVLMVAFSIVPTLLVGRLWYEQLRQGDGYRKAISKQSVRRIRLAPVRGRMFSSDEQLICDNEPAYDVYFHIHEMRQPGKSAYARSIAHIQSELDRIGQQLERDSSLSTEAVRARWREEGEIVAFPKLDAGAQAKLHDIRFVTGMRLRPSGSGHADVICEFSKMQQERKSGRQMTRAFVLEQITRVSELIVRPVDTSLDQLRSHMRVYPALPYRAFRALSDHELAALLEVMPGIPGLEVSTNMKRIYPMREIGSHWVGFVGRRDPATEVDRANYNFWLPELHGRLGLERKFDTELRGAGGVKMVRVDSVGFLHDVVGVARDANAGDDLLLTVDSRAQRIAQSLVAGKRAALVALDCRSGAIVAMASAPSFDLAHIGSIYGDLINNPNKPLLNRATYASYAPGSIVKPLVALAALKAGTIDADSEIYCPGYYEIGNAKPRCGRRSGHGDVNVTSALEGSCNPFFMDCGVRTGVEKVARIFEQAGIGQVPGSEVDSIWARGLRPGREAMREQTGRSWRVFDTALVSMGQGFITVSPLQAAMFTAAIANGGTVYKPYIVRAVRGADGHFRRVTRPVILSTLDASAEHLDIVHTGMHQVVHGFDATAPAARSAIVELAGKTGTAQIGTPANRRQNTWFTCFGPFENPRFAVTVLVEDGESGGQSAAPLARQFFESYLTALEAADKTAGVQ
jgi:penicillin-binding protein 2